jgi:glycosyltransferase involved in cell wall biosynthesis
MLFFWTPDDRVPLGGIKQIYRHAELLQRGGLESRVLHTRPGFVCSWFEHAAPMAYLGETFSRRTRQRAGTLLPRVTLAPDLRLFKGRKIQLASRAGVYSDHELSADDVLVFPEYLGAALIDAGIELPMVIFNQNVHGTFRGYGFNEQPTSTIYSKPNVLGAIVVSEHSRRYLKYVFEELDVHRVVNGVDSSLFHPNDAPRHRQVAFMPRKQPQHLEQVINILNLRGALDGWTLAPIQGLSESGVAEILRHTFLYLSTCHEEGFGLPPVEAGMAGCLVVGYTGLAADEYFEEGLADRVEQDDVLGFAQAVERTLAWIEADEAKAIEKGRAFSDFLTQRYSLEHERESVLSAWQSLLAKQ